MRVFAAEFRTPSCAGKLAAGLVSRYIANGATPNSAACAQ